MICKICNKEIKSKSNRRKTCGSKCSKEYNRRYRSEYILLWRKNNPEKTKEYNRKFRINNPEYSKNYMEKKNEQNKA